MDLDKISSEEIDTNISKKYDNILEYYNLINKTSNKFICNK